MLRLSLVAAAMLLGSPALAQTPPAPNAAAVPPPPAQVQTPPPGVIETRRPARPGELAPDGSPATEVIVVSSSPVHNPTDGQVDGQPRQRAATPRAPAPAPPAPPPPPRPAPRSPSAPQ